MDFLFYEYPDRYYPFDYKTYEASPTRFVMVVSNCLTGRAEYIEEKQDRKRLLDACKASCSLPVMCPLSWLDGKPMVDGGVCDSIPIRHAQEEGYRKNVIILTRNKGYRKPEKDFHLPSFIYRQYPAIRERLRLRYRAYNQMMDEIDRTEERGEILAIRPINPVEVGRTERNITKLQALYDEGYACGAQILTYLTGKASGGFTR